MIDKPFTDEDDVADEMQNASKDKESNYKYERDSARFQIERAIAVLEGPSVMYIHGEDSAMYADRMIVAGEAIIKLLRAFVESEGGPWYQSG